MIKILSLLLVFLSAAFADDLYLKNGIVYKNIRVIDSTEISINILRDTIRMEIKKDLIDKIEYYNYSPNLKSTREIYSQSKYDDYFQIALQMNNAIQAANKKRTDDSLYQYKHILDSIQPYRRSLYFALGLGKPLGSYPELGYRFPSLLSIAIQYYWASSDKYLPGINLTLWYPINSSFSAIYFSYMVGSSLNIYGGQDSYRQICIGSIIPFELSNYFRPEVGITFTSKYLHGSWSEFDEGKYEERKRIYISIAYEIDFR